MSSGRRQATKQNEPLAKRRRTRRQPAVQQPQQQQQQQTQGSGLPPTVTSLPSRPTAMPVRQSRSMDSGDQIAPTSPRSSRRTVSQHVSDQVAPDIPSDPIMQHQVSSLPKESFKLTNTDFIWLVSYLHVF